MYFQIVGKYLKYAFRPTDPRLQSLPDAQRYAFIKQVSDMERLKDSPFLEMAKEICNASKKKDPFCKSLIEEFLLGIGNFYDADILDRECFKLAYIDGLSADKIVIRMEDTTGERIDRRTVYKRIDRVNRFFALFLYPMMCFSNQ